ncbi:MAG: protoporphyrinogen oxidase [Gemmatimonadota bacterium]
MVSRDEVIRDGRDGARSGPVEERCEVGVVGAGLSGLLLSRELSRRGTSHIVLESSDRAGGVIRTSRSGSGVLEHGPQRTRLTPAIRALVEELGLTGELVAVPPHHPLFVVRGGKLHRVPFSLKALLATGLLSWGGKARLLLEPLTSVPRKGETVGEYFSRKLGREGCDYLAGPLFGGLYGSDPYEMYVRHALEPTLRRVGVTRSLLLRALSQSRGSESLPAVSFREGMGMLVDRLYHAVQDHVRLSTPVRSARREGDLWALELGSADGGSGGPVDHPITVRKLVLTVPSLVAAGILRATLPEVAGRLDALAYNSLAIVHLHADCEGLHGLGYQVAYGESLRTRGVTWNASALQRSGIYTAFMGGARDPEVEEMSDADVGALAAREFEAVTGCPARVVGVSRTRMPAWDRSWEALDGLSLPSSLHLCANYESRPGIPGRFAQVSALAGKLV